MSSIYSDGSEEKIYSRKTATTWHRSGLINDAQMGFIKDRTETGLRRINTFFRITLFLFTLLAMQAIAGLVTILYRLESHGTLEICFLILGAIACVLAEYVTSKHSLYHYGVEEALYVMGMTGVSFFLCHLLFRDVTGPEEAIPYLIVLALGFSWLYWRLGLAVYAAIAIALAAAIPFTLKIPQEFQRLITLALLAVTFFTLILRENTEEWNFRKTHLVTLQALCFGGIYCLANLHLTTLMLIGQARTTLPPYQGVSPVSYWISYALIWLIPLTGLYLGVQTRKRLLIDAGLVCAILTLATNKDYLGLKHYAWDPMILGTALVLASIFLKQWLARGDGEMRGGFTAEKILAEDKTGQELLQGVAAMAVADAGPTNAQGSTTEQPFQGGTSGGGGASGNF